MFWFCVIVRIVANPISNVFQKLLARENAAPLCVVGVAHGLLSLACAGVLLIEPWPADSGFWRNMLISTVLAVAGNVLIVQALRISDLSFLGPVNAYKAVVSLLPAVVLLNELPTPAALIGIALIVIGSYLITGRDGAATWKSVFVRFVGDRGVQYRLAALVLSATEAVFLKRALVASSPLLTFVVWSLAGFVLPSIAVIAYGRARLGKEARILRANWRTCALLAATTGLMQFCTLVILTGFQVAAALALFQTSTLLTVVLGWRVFHEQQFAKRFLGSLVMVVGAVLIILTSSQKSPGPRQPIENDVRRQENAEWQHVSSGLPPSNI